MITKLIIISALSILTITNCSPPQIDEKLAAEKVNTALVLWGKSTSFNVSELFNPLSGPNESELDKIINLLEESVKYDPNLGQAHYYLAIAYMHQRKIERSIIEFYKSIQLGSDNELVYELLFGLLIERKNFKGASELISFFSSKYPNKKAEKLAFEARLLFFLKKFPEAIKIAEQLIRLDEKSKMGYMVLAKSYYSIDDIPEAKNAFSSYLDLDDDLRKAVIDKTITMEDILDD